MEFFQSNQLWLDRFLNNQQTFYILNCLYIGTEIQIKQLHRTENCLIFIRLATVVGCT